MALQRRKKRVVQSLLAAALLIGGLGVTATSPAVAEPTGPPLTVPQQMLDQSVRCTADVTPTSGKKAVLLVGGVGFDPADAWSWGYTKALSRAGFGVCEVSVANHGRGDATIGAEYVVNAIRYATVRSGQQVDVVAHSAGPALAMWAMRFSPDVAASVDDMVALAAPLHGTLLANVVCVVFCPALAHQLSYGSAFTAALDRALLPSSVSVTSIFSLFDEGIQPAREVSSYPGAANIALQDHCPGRLVEHVGQMFDAAAYRLVIDALTHPGPAVAARTAQLCDDITLPGFEIPAFVPSLVQGSIKYLGILGEPPLPVAPPLPAYARQG